MRIEIFGMGCAKCSGLEKTVRRLVAEMGLEAEIVKVQDLDAMVDRGVMTSPAMAIDGKVVLQGRVPPEPELRALLAGGRQPHGD